MVKQLKSHLAGRWVSGEGPYAPLLDPTSEEVLAETSTRGLDLCAAVAFARQEGLPALQALTFAERGELLMQASKALHACRDELLELSTRSGGNTRGDAKFDVDGAIGTLAFYAKLGEKMGEARFLVDGAGVQLGRSPRYWGEHLRVSRQGVAVHVNAFNFPGWGMAAKAAVALLAGLPVITKPATATSVLAQRMVELWVEAQVFPAGAFSLLCGSVGDLLEHLEGQDVLAFTGSSHTALKLRKLSAVQERGCRLNVEADSLNAAVLGVDAQPGSATFDLFLRDVVRDMTQKAGQKCTAIRRVLVPREHLAAVREALVEELGRVSVGDPAMKGVGMGPLATASQLEDVQAGVEALLSAGEPVFGWASTERGRGPLQGVAVGKGFFLNPVLVQAEDPAAAAIHEREVFGPVATILPYSGDPDEAGRLVALGRGGLVSSVYSDDPELSVSLALAMAPFHGRLNLGSAKVAEHSLGPGAVLPQMLHGGPGRAGGGEELGGLRGLGLYLQRTALQGYKPFLERLAERGHRS